VILNIILGNGLNCATRGLLRGGSYKKYNTTSNKRLIKMEKSLLVRRVKMNIRWLRGRNVDIYMYRMKGLTYQAIGDLFSISKSRVAQIVRRAERMLRNPEMLKFFLEGK